MDKHLRWLAGLSVLVGGFLVLGAGLWQVRTLQAQEPASTEEPAAPTSDTASDDDLIARGEYLVRVAAACVDCHSAAPPYRGSALEPDTLTAPPERRCDLCQHALWRGVWPEPDHPARME
ncbi:MAG: hypothetical protein HC915_16360 [Anaerolineae bacterium]|nr:hypothetical protein [Anaerolineae bacterium]